MKKLYTASAIAAALLSAPLASQGQVLPSVQGQTNVTVRLPGVIVLHYVSDVTFDIPASYFGGAEHVYADSTPKTLVGLDDTVHQVNVVDGPAEAKINATTAYIRDAWAVSSRSSSGQSEVAITLDTATASNTTAGGSIALSNAQVSADGSNFGATTTFDSPGMGKSKAVYGDVSLLLDMTNATSAGDYTGAKYTITATNI